MPENFGRFVLVVIVFLVGIVVLQWWGGSSKTAVLPVRPFTDTGQEETDKDLNGG